MVVTARVGLGDEEATRSVEESVAIEVHASVLLQP
jgi:hypothetical protein